MSGDTAPRPAPPGMTPQALHQAAVWLRRVYSAGAAIDYANDLDRWADELHAAAGAEAVRPPDADEEHVRHDYVIRWNADGRYLSRRERDLDRDSTWQAWDGIDVATGFQSEVEARIYAVERGIRVDTRESHLHNERLVSLREDDVEVLRRRHTVALADGGRGAVAVPEDRPGITRRVEVDEDHEIVIDGPWDTEHVRVYAPPPLDDLVVWASCAMDTEDVRLALRAALGDPQLAPSPTAAEVKAHADAGGSVAVDLGRGFRVSEPLTSMIRSGAVWWDDMSIPQPGLRLDAAEVQP